MKDAFRVGHRLAKGLALGDVADMELDAKRLQKRGLFDRPDERDHRMTASDQLFDQLAAEKSGGASHEVTCHALLKYIGYGSLAARA